tara:strand:+ start:285 stop:593 length:309 start_codon:yes stop_codon:yes gene_type:complete
MKKSLVISLILSLILFTALIKNSTKRIDDEIFVINENLRILEKEFGDLKLENNYLSSGKKLMELQSEYFDKNLESKKTDQINFLIQDKKKLIIKNLEISEGD